MARESSFLSYLGYTLKQAVETWKANNGNVAPDAVDIITHSTGGLVARSYVQSEAYNLGLDLDAGVPAGFDPNAFVDLLGGELHVIYSTDHESPAKAEESELSKMALLGQKHGQV